MKKIVKEIKLLMRVYKSYRLIITNNCIEARVTPESNSEDEINWVVANDKAGRLDLLLYLQQESSNHNLAYI